MCTLTWEHTSNGYDLLFNRDERRSRAAARPPREVQPGIIAPIDPEGGGSWIAVNRYGISVCLLNWYAADSHGPRSPVRQPHPRREYRSRGGIVLAAAEGDSLGAVARSLHSLPLPEYRPFLLWAIAPGQSPIMLRWNGDQLVEELVVSSPVTTSSAHPRRVLARRQRLYRRLVSRAGQPHHAVRLAYHRSRFRLWPGDSVAMQRPQAQSVSLTHIAVDAGSVSMAYLPGNPADSPPANPQSSQPALSTRHRLGLPREAAQPLPGSAPPPDCGPILHLRRTFAAKNPQLARRLPGWSFSLIAQLLQLRRLQRIIRLRRLVPSRQFPAAALEAIHSSGQVTGSTPPSPAQRPVYLANHPVGGLDGLALLQLLLRWYPVVRVISTDILAGLPHLRPFLLPVDTYHGHRSILHSLHGAFASNACILVFPAGRTARLHQGRLREFPWQKTAVQMALEHRRPVVPVSIRARNSYCFYLIHRIRTLCGIPWNLEMFLLPRELLRRRSGRRLQIYRHAPLSAQQHTELGPENRQPTAALQGVSERGVQWLS